MFCCSGEIKMNKKIKTKRLEDLLIEITGLRVNTTLAEDCFQIRARERALHKVRELKHEYFEVIRGYPEEKYLDALEKYYEPKESPPTISQRATQYFKLRTPQLEAFS